MTAFPSHSAKRHEVARARGGMGFVAKRRISYLRPSSMADLLSWTARWATDEMPNISHRIQRDHRLRERRPGKRCRCDGLLTLPSITLQSSRSEGRVVAGCRNAERAGLPARAEGKPECRNPTTYSARRGSARSPRGRSTAAQLIRRALFASAKIHARVSSTSIAEPMK